MKNPSRRVEADALHQPAGLTDNKKPVRNSNRPLTRCLKKRTGKPQFSFGSPCWTRFAAAKPRRLQQSTGLLPSAAFRVRQGELLTFRSSFLTKKKEELKNSVPLGSPCWTRTNDTRINSPSLYRLS